MAERVMDKVGPMIEAALDKHGQGEQIWWESSVLPGQPGPAQLICLWITGAVLGSTINHVIVHPNPPGWTEAEIDRAVREGCEQMRGLRSRQLAEMNGKPGGGMGIGGLEKP